MSRRLTPQNPCCRKGFAALAKRVITRRPPAGLTCALPQRLFVLLGLLVFVAAAPCPAESGPVICWGDYARTGRNPVPGNNYRAVCAGGYHALALTTDGKLVTWGENIRGQCNAPHGGGFRAIAAGLYHSVALKADGSVVVWGDNSRGQCNAPKDRRFRAIAAGSWHSLGICPDGSLVAWGWNDEGQCNVPPGDDYIGISAGYYHSVALRADGSLVAWGCNSDGQCNVPAGNDVVQVAAGALHSVALRSDGSVVAWGRSKEGQCRVPAGNNFVAVAAGSVHSLALTRDGCLVAWGHDDNTLCDVPANERYAVIAAGGSHSLAIRGSPVAPVTAGMVKAVALGHTETMDNTPTKTAVSRGPVSTSARSTADAGPEPEKTVPAQPVDLRSSTAREPDRSARAKSFGGNGGPAAAPTTFPASPTSRTGAGAAGGVLASAETVKPAESSRRDSNAEVGGSGAPLVLKHATPDRTVASVPPGGLKTAAAPEPRVASLIGARDTGRSAALPRPQPKMPPTAGLDAPGVLRNAPAKRPDALAPHSQGQPATAPAPDKTLAARAQGFYDGLFEQGRLPGVLSWAGRPVDLIAIVVFAMSILSIIALLFRR